MHLGDSIFIFILALVLFGPKKLPEMAKQIGKLMAEFRRASADFRMQIDEELRTIERQEQTKKQETERTALSSPAGSSEPSILPPATQAELGSGEFSSAAPAGDTLQIMPPTLGEQVSAGSPYAVSAVPGPVEPAAEDHPLLRVNEIPAHDGPSGMAAAEANAARLPTHPAEPEPEQATLHNG